MDPLASVILHNRPMTFYKRQESPRILERAESNRVLYLFMKRISEFTRDKVIHQKYVEIRKRKIEYEKGARELLRKLMKANTKFLVLKTARYPHLSFDIDLLFKSAADFEKSISILIKSTIRPDPHASGLREYKGTTIVLPTEELWRRRKTKKLYSISVNVPSEEDSAIIFLLHMIKHREIFLGDLISLANLEINEQLFRELVVHFKLTVMANFVSKLLDNLEIPDQRYRVKVNLPVLNPLISLIAEKTSHEHFPIKLPKQILYLASLKLI